MNPAAEDSDIIARRVLQIDAVRFLAAASTLEGSELSDLVRRYGLEREYGESDANLRQRFERYAYGE